jgi:hypothetical protein
MCHADQLWTQHATPPLLRSCTATSSSVPTSSSGRTQRAVLWSPPPLQPPLPGPVTERENIANPRAGQARHRVNRKGQAGLHAERDWPRDHPAADASPDASPPPVARNIHTVYQQPVNWSSSVYSVFIFPLAVQPNSGLGHLHESFRFTSVTRSRTVGRTP